MSRTERQETVETLAREFQASPNLYLTDFTGLDVGRMTELRRRLRTAGLRYLVVKNTLAQRALETNQVSGVAEFLAGPTGFVLAGDDPIVAAKVLTEFAREFENRPAIKMGLVEGRPVTAEQVKQLALLPSREALLSQLAGALQAPLAQFAGAMNAMLTQVVGALEALHSQRGAGS